MASNNHHYLALLFVALACICDSVTAAGPQRTWTQDYGRTIITEGTETSQRLDQDWELQHFDSRWTSQQRFEPRWATQQRSDPSWTPQQRFDPIWTPRNFDYPQYSRGGGVKVQRTPTVSMWTAAAGTRSSPFDTIWTPRHFDYRPQYSNGGGAEMQRTPAESMWTVTADSRSSPFDPVWTPRHFDYPQYSRGGGAEEQRTPAESMWTVTAGTRSPPFDPIWTPRHFDYRPQYSNSGAAEVRRTPAASMWTVTADSRSSPFDPSWTSPRYDYPQYGGRDAGVRRTPGIESTAAAAGYPSPSSSPRLPSGDLGHRWYGRFEEMLRRTPKPISAAVSTSSSETAAAPSEMATESSEAAITLSSSVITPGASVTRAMPKRPLKKGGIMRALPRRTASTKGAGVWPATTTSVMSSSAVPIFATGDLAVVRCGTRGPCDCPTDDRRHPTTSAAEVIECTTTAAAECTTSCTPKIDVEYEDDNESGDQDFGCRSGWTHLHILAIIGVVFITSVCLAEYCKSNQCRHDAELNEITVHVQKLNCACKATYKCCELPSDLRPTRSF